jgi:hypothetical protein
MTARLILCMLWMLPLYSETAVDWPWRPFEPVRRPPVPAAAADDGRGAIDAFLREALAAKGLAYREPAPRATLMRRVYLDLIGLAPTPEEQSAFLDDPAPDAYERLVDRLLADPRHAERWARHWMDVWRYSDWAGWNDGKQIRDSQPHIWRWRDWIVDALANDLGYDRMLIDMLAADERAPEDADAHRATGFLARNYKMLSREQWLEDTVKHSSLAFMGLTVGCAKCHDHKTDPLPQTDYYALRAIFEPHQVRLDPVPGQSDPAVDGLPRAYDADLAAPTFFFPRGDERAPDKNRPVSPGVPALLGGSLHIEPVALPPSAIAPHRRESARRDLETAAVAATRVEGPDSLVARARLASLRAVLAVERLEETGRGRTPEWEHAARTAQAAQRAEAVTTALRQVVATTLAHAEAAIQGTTQAAEHAKKLADARAALATARTKAAEPLTTEYTPRPAPTYPSHSSGRRLAFATWLTRPHHPLTARVAVNHVWARHFGAGLAPSLADFGTAARPPSHPALLDWLAAEFMDHQWSFRHLHRLICLSDAYRQSSAETAAAAEPVTGAPDPAAIDPDNRLLWRFQPRRLEAEAVRDNLLHLTGGLDLARGGPEIDHTLALTSGRRSLYLRCAAEKQPEFLQVFDGPSVVECYERKPSVMPQQALALLNSELAIARARAATAAVPAGQDDASLIEHAFIRFLSRRPTAAEADACRKFLRDRRQDGASEARARTLFHLTLLNHHEFLTLR